MKAMLLVVAAGLTITCSAADKPNFSGEWKMIPAKSNFGLLPAPESFLRKIAHSEPNITIEEEQLANGTESKSKRNVRTDGHPVALEINGSPVTAAVAWDDNDLIAITSLDNNTGLKFTDRMSLSEDGKLLTSKVAITSFQGDVELIVVFERQ